MCTSTKALVIGDSIAAGDHLQWGWWDGWASRVDPVRCRYGPVVNGAVGGSGVGAVASRLPAQLAEHDPDEVWCLVGTNDLCHITPTAVCTAIGAIAQSVVASGARWRVGTICPTGVAYPWRSCHEPDRQAVNGWLRAVYPGALFDFDAALRAPSGVLDPTYDVGDALHPNVWGHVRMADTARNALAANP